MPASHDPPTSRWAKPFAFGLTVFTAIGAAVMAAVVYAAFARQDAVAIDYRMFVELGRRWAEDGTMYLPYQLAGPFDYDVGSAAHDPSIMPSLYPPIAAPVFWSLTFLPAALWWAIPIAGLAIAARGAKPWTWPLLPLAAWFPATPALFVVGGFSMWVVAGLALGVRYGWPVLIVAFKPTLAIFGLVGAHHRSTWIGFIPLAVLSLLLLPEWLRYVTVLRNLISPGMTYSLLDVPLVIAAMVTAWSARVPQARAPVREVPRRVRTATRYPAGAFDRG